MLSLLLFLQLYLNLFVPSSWLIPSYDIGWLTFFLRLALQDNSKIPTQLGREQTFQKGKMSRESSHTDSVSWGWFLVFRHSLALICRFSPRYKHTLSAYGYLSGRQGSIFHIEMQSYLQMIDPFYWELTSRMWTMNLDHYVARRCSILDVLNREPVLYL